MEFDFCLSNCTPIYYAVKFSKIECVKALLQHDDIDLDCANNIFKIIIFLIMEFLILACFMKRFLMQLSQKLKL